MDSLEPSCTPSKHEYDACFNKWFERYLHIADHAAYPSSGSAKGKGKAGEGVMVVEAAPGDGDRKRQEAMRKSKEEYERDCGAKWKAYQDCLGRAIDLKGLRPLLDEARRNDPIKDANHLASETA